MAVPSRIFKIGSVPNSSVRWFLKAQYTSFQLASSVALSDLLECEVPATYVPFKNAIKTMILVFVLAAGANLRVYLPINVRGKKTHEERQD